MRSRSFFTGVFRTLPLSVILTGAFLGSGTLPAAAQTITSGVDRTLPRVCVQPCIQQYEKIAADNAGNAIAVWQEEELADGPLEGDGLQQMVTSRFSATTGAWSAPRVMPKGIFNNKVVSPGVGMDASGNGLVTWTEFEDATGYFVIRFARYIAAQNTWTTPATVERSTRYNASNDLLVARNGNALLQQIGSSSGYLGHYYDAATRTWHRLGSDTGGRDYREGAIDELGNAVVPYRIFGPDSDTLYAVRFNWESKQLSSPTKLDESLYVNGVPAGEIGGPAASKDRFGNDMVVWQKRIRASDGSSVRTIRSARYQAGKAQWVSKPVSKLNNNAITVPVLVADQSANVSAIWTQYIGYYRRVVFARYSSSTGTWTTPRPISAGSFLARDASVDVDPQGNLIASWSQRSDPGSGSSFGKIFRTLAARYSVASGVWSSPTLVQDANVNSYFPQLDVDGQGKGFVLWNEDTPATDDGDAKRLRADRVFLQ